MSTVGKKKQNSYDRANLISQIYSLHAIPFLFQNYRKDINLDAIDPCAKPFKCETLGNQLKKNWNYELENRSPKSVSLLRAIGKTFGLQFLSTNVTNFFAYGILQMSMSVILGRIIFYARQYFEDKQDAIDEPDFFNRIFAKMDTRENVIFYSALLCAIIFVNVLVFHPFFNSVYRYGMTLRVAVTRLIYAKALRITSQSVHRITGGKIVNLISTDANRLDIAYVYVGFVHMAVLETALGMFLMYQYIGRSCLGALAIVVVYIPFQTIMANILSKFRSKSITLTDDRVRLMAEILPAMRVIKMYVWERPFSKLVHLARKLEISKIRQSLVLRSINLALYFVAPKAMSFLCIILFILDGGELNAESVFVTLALIGQIRQVITYFFPVGISFGVEAYISMKRIEKFLLEEETDHQQPSLNSNSEQNQLEPCKISLNHVTVKSELNNSLILNDISFDVTPGKLTTIIGPVGSGKTSILLSALNELQLSNPDVGKVQVTGKVVYVSQEAWIFTGTVRDNILFGAPFEPNKYREVVKMTAMSADFKQFENGDQTMVEDRGTSLSGGQKARISLARALYTDADCYLLDDPISAVDASVAKHIFEKCIKEHLKNKVVVLVTHQLHFIKQADQIVVIKDGCLMAKGSYTDLLSKGIDVFKYSNVEQEKQQQLESKRKDSRISEASFRSSRASSLAEIEAFDNISLYDYGNISNPIDSTTNPTENSATKQTNENLSNSKKSSKISKLKIYWIYFRSGGGFLLLSLFLIANLITQVLFTGTDYWLSAWTDFKDQESIQAVNPNHTISKNPIVSTKMHVNVVIYSILVALLFLFSIIRTVSYFTISMRSSVTLHRQFFKSLISAPIEFFDKTPIGMIMNRVSRDFGIIDDLLPPTAYEAQEILLNSFAVVVLCIILNYIILFPFIILVGLIYAANKFYVNTARKLKRLEGAARSPLFNQVASTLNGLPTIRSYGAQSMLLRQFSNTQDQHTAIYFTFLCVGRVYGIFLELTCVAYIYCLILLVNLDFDSYTASIIGLTISQSLQLTNQFNWGIRQSTEVETFMTSVERIVEFSNLDQEALEPTESPDPEDSTWPKHGDVEYENVSLMYKSDNDESKLSKPVLKNLTFQIFGGEKIGIVGRTGAGKSSLITTLFRLTQPVGLIKIDGVDTAEISLASLRRCLSIIPQEPILFSGTIRRNLDPFSEKNDDELWDAIEKVQLKQKIHSLPGRLEAKVAEGGSDFSVGQKQLICLARAILRKNRILILDEATANVDPHTDAMIQQTIRREFAQCTVLTIAHRLNTIIDYDRVMVLDDGELVQFDTPQQLIRQEEGIFYELYKNLPNHEKK